MGRYRRRLFGGEGETISVIIPTYYRNDRLRQAIESVEDQTYDQVEVVDGSGEAHARPVVESLDVTYLPQETDRGAQAARNYGAEQTDGEYVQFLNDDDRLLPEKFERQLPLFNDDDVGVVYCGIHDEEWGRFTRTRRFGGTPSSERCK